MRVKTPPTHASYHPIRHSRSPLPIIPAPLLVIPAKAGIHRHPRPSHHTRAPILPRRGDRPVAPTPSRHNPIPTKTRPAPQSRPGASLLPNQRRLPVSTPTSTSRTPTSPSLTAAPDTPQSPLGRTRRSGSTRTAEPSRSCCTGNRPAPPSAESASPCRS